MDAECIKSECLIDRILMMRCAFTMRLLPIYSCEPGMRLGKPVFNEEGVVLLGENVELSQQLISRLRQLGIDYLYVKDGITDDVIIPDTLSEETRMRAVAEIRTSFRQQMEEHGGKRIAKHPLLGKSFNNVLQMIIDDLSDNRGMLIMMNDMNIVDNYLFQHALNVTIITLTLGIIHGYAKNDLVTLGIGSMMHDIGMTKIDRQIWNKRGKLSDAEYAEIQKHPMLGFQLLKDQTNVPLLSAHCALQHHERSDGSGYPRNLKEKETHDYAKWIAIADSFDAMTTHRPHRFAMLPHQAMETLFACSVTLYDRQKVALFRDNVAIYPLGLTVRLNTGEKGVVVQIQPAYPQRPTVRIIESPDGKKLEQHELYEVDLSKKLSVLIDKVEL